MSTTKLVAPVHRERAYRTFIVLPPLALAAVIGIGFWREQLAEGEFRSAIATHVSRNEPVGNASLTKFFDTETTRETSEQWQRIAASAAALSGKYDGTTVNEFDRLVPENETWAAEAFANELSDEAQPILNELRELAGSGKPVWQPILFDAINTRLEELQTSREIGRLLANEFRVAYHAGDSARAAEILSIFRKYIAAYDWQSTTVVGLFHIATVNWYHEQIRRSLASDFWTEGELKQIRETLKPDPNLDERWKNMIAGDRVMAFAAMRAVESTSESTSGAFSDMPVAPLGIAPTQVREMLNLMDKISDVKDAGTRGHTGAVADFCWGIQWKHKMRDLSFTGMPFAMGEPILRYYLPAFQAASNAFTMAEDSRRWTLTAVAVKQFQLQEKRWPETLDELSLVGLSSADMNVDGQSNFYESRFGYRIVDRGSRVLLWTSDDFSSFRRVSPGPPKENDPSRPQFTITIR